MAVNPEKDVVGYKIYRSTDRSLPLDQWTPLTADLLKTNTGIVKAVAIQIKTTSPNAFVIVVSNPLDAMSYVMKQVTGFPREQVIGMATRSVRQLHTHASSILTNGEHLPGLGNLDRLGKSLPQPFGPGGADGANRKRHSRLVWDPAEH